MSKRNLNGQKISASQSSSTSMSSPSSHMSIPPTSPQTEEMGASKKPQLALALLPKERRFAVQKRLSAERKQEILNGLSKGIYEKHGVLRKGVFSKVVNKNTREQIAVICNKCDNIYKVGNTGPFSYHSKACEGKEGVHQLPLYNTPAEEEEEEAKKKMTTHYLAKLCALDDAAPFTTVEHQGFRSFTDHLIALCSEWGKESLIENVPSQPPTPPATEILPSSHCRTVVREVHDASSIDGFNKFVSSNLRNNGGAISLGSTSKNFQYSAIAVHFIDDDMIYHNYCLDIQNVWGKDAINIRKDTVDTLMRHGIEEDILKSIWIVTDEAPAMKAAFEDCNRLDCSAHMSYTVSKRIVEPYKSPKFMLSTNLDKNVSDEIRKVNTAMKNAIQVINGVNARLELSHELSVPLTYFSAESRWLSRKTRLEKFLKTTPQDREMIRKEFAKTNASQPLEYAIRNSQFLQNYLEAIEPIHQAIEHFENESAPTLNSVLVVYHDLRHRFHEMQTSDQMTTSALGTLGEQILKQKFEKSFQKVHYLALLLDPFQKNQMLAFTEDSEVEKHIECLKDEARKLQPRQVDQPANKLSFKRFQKEASDPISKEVDIYLAIEPQELTLYHSVLEFWKANQQRFPSLAKLVKKILSIPASSCFVERPLNRMTYQHQRANLHPETVKYLVDLITLEKYRLAATNK